MEQWSGASLTEHNVCSSPGGTQDQLVQGLDAENPTTKTLTKSRRTHSSVPVRLPYMTELSEHLTSL